MSRTKNRTSTRDARTFLPLALAAAVLIFPAPGLVQADDGAQNPRLACAILDLRAINWMEDAHNQATEEPDYQSVSQDRLAEALNMVLEARVSCTLGDIAGATQKYERVIARLAELSRDAYD